MAASRPLSHTSDSYKLILEYVGVESLFALARTSTTHYCLTSDFLHESSQRGRKAGGEVQSYVHFLPSYPEKVYRKVMSEEKLEQQAAATPANGWLNHSVVKIVMRLPPMASFWANLQANTEAVKPATAEVAAWSCRFLPAARQDAERKDQFLKLMEKEGALPKRVFSPRNPT